MSTSSTEIPRGNVTGFTKYMKQDMVSGFLVFLIALPLCLGISLACGYPPLAGIFTAIIGSIVTTFISNSELTIKGPAAGLIVIAIGCIEDFGGSGFAGEVGPEDLSAYKAALAVGVAAAVLQMIFALFRTGKFAEFFPTSTVHGMLAAIGVIIIAKQFPVALGVSAKGEPLELLREIPHFIAEANPAIASIGLVSILILFLWPVIGRRVPLLKPIPAAMVVLLVAVPMGMGFDLMHEHSYVLQGHKYQLSEQYLVSMPNRVFGMFDEVTFPEFSALSQMKAWKWAFMFFIIGSLESVLSAKAVDIIDPWKRKTNMDRDLLAVGTANLLCAFVGGLPMISEIVRSKANIDNGARTRFADMWHGVFLLLCVALIPTFLHRIPLAALAAMLVYTGFRLAHPSEFMHIYRTGREQLVIFATTLVAVLATDLLIGIAIGIGVKFFIHLMNGVPVNSLFKAHLDIEPQEDEQTCVIRAHHSAVFSNWIPFRRQIEDIGITHRQNVILDLSDTKLVDHSVMGNLQELQRDFEEQGLTLTLTGLEAHRPLSKDETAARKRGIPTIERVTIIADESIQQRLEDWLLNSSVIGFSSVPYTGTQSLVATGNGHPRVLVCLQVLVSNESGLELLAFLREEIAPDHFVKSYVETLRVVDLGEQPASGRDEVKHLQMTSK
ncbi:MAG: SulP family inorganic anion transporter [Planctomycetaceae bacterium]